MAEHRPAPLELNEHHVVPLFLGGEDVEDNRIFICPTTHTNTHELLREFVKRGHLLTFRECVEIWEPPVSEYAYWLARRGFLQWKGAA